MPLFGPPDVEKLKARRDVQGLIKALDYQKDAGIRKQAAEALGELRDSRVMDALISALGDPDWQVRMRAVERWVSCGAIRWSIRSVRCSRIMMPPCASMPPKR